MPGMRFRCGRSDAVELSEEAVVDAWVGGQRPWIHRRVQEPLGSTVKNGVNDGVNDG